MDEELIPVAHCVHCDKDVPVIIAKLNELPNLPEILADMEFEVVVCPICTSILNNQEDLEVEWFDAEGLEEMGYEIVREPTGGTGAGSD